MILTILWELVFWLGRLATDPLVFGVLACLLSQFIGKKVFFTRQSSNGAQMRLIIGSYWLNNLLFTIAQSCRFHRRFERNRRKFLGHLFGRSRERKVLFRTKQNPSFQSIHNGKILNLPCGLQIFLQSEYYTVDSCDEFTQEISVDWFDSGSHTMGPRLDCAGDCPIRAVGGFSNDKVRIAVLKISRRL